MDVEFRQKAKFCLARAKELITRGDDASVRYACLELRFAIEYLVHQQMKGYLDEVGDDALRKWTPKQIIAEMITVDPYADKTARIAIGVEGENGSSPKQMKVVGEIRRFSLKWANENYNALGSFLHAPTLFQIESGKEPVSAKILSKAIAIASTIEHTLDSSIYHFNVGPFYTLTCDCGREIKRRRGSFRTDDGVVCPSCSTIYDIMPGQDDVCNGVVRFVKRTVSFDCGLCGAKNTVGAHCIKEGHEFNCECGSNVRVVLALSFTEQV